MEEKEIAIDLGESLRCLIGQTCWGIVAGEGTGSIIQLYLGKKILRKTPVSNPHLTEVQQRYESELTLLIECIWRLDSNSKIICGAEDDNTTEGYMIGGLKQVVDQTVCSIALIEPAFDLVIKFSNQVTLRVFCNEINPIDQGDNYSFYLPDRVLIVGNRSHLRIEQRKSSDNMDL